MPRGRAIRRTIRAGSLWPLVDTITGSKRPNLKELRPGSAGGNEVQMLFVFDPQRRAVFLVGGDKLGKWSDCYQTAIPRAEDASPST